MAVGVLDPYGTVLLDMNGTFMFGHDQFSPDQDYHGTYRALGGIRLAAAAVRRAVDDCHGRMAAPYDDPRHVDRFPQVRYVLARSPACAGWPAADVDLVEAVIARHERGTVPAEYAAALGRLAATHLLGLVTNIWSRKPPWLDELRRAGVLDLFAVTVFSSDGPSVKPSPALFRRAVTSLRVSPQSVVVVGDSLRCDVGGAAAAGLASVWINPAGEARPRPMPAPTFEVRDLIDLVSAGVSQTISSSPAGPA